MSNAAATAANEHSQPELQVDLSKLEAILARHRDHKGALIPVLQETQEAYGYVPRSTVPLIARALGVPVSKIYGVMTFYAQFHLEPRGRNVIRVCQGTACHVRGGAAILEEVSEQLHIQPGQTTPDLRFTLERVACLGACGLAPAMMVNDTTYGRLTKKKIKEVLAKYE